MLIIALLWSLIASVCVAVGLEPPRTWKRVLKGNINATIPKAALSFGAFMSVIVITGSFYYFVVRNAVIVLVAWILLFALIRLIIEIMLRRNVYGEPARVDPYSYLRHDANALSRTEAKPHAVPTREVAGAQSEVEMPVDEPLAKADVSLPSGLSQGGKASYQALFERVNAHDADHHAAPAPKHKKRAVHPKRPA